MPRGDRTGPMGQGPASGRGLGYCRGQETLPWPDAGRGTGLGLRRGRGGGFGRRGGFFGATGAGWTYSRGGLPTREELLEGLKTDADWLKAQLEAVNKRIEDFEK
jgi:hypothetical protein